MRKLFNQEFSSVAGSGTRILYSSRVLKDGTIVLEPSGKEDLHARIQADADSTDLSKIIAYYRQSGDSSVLQRNGSGSFFDTTSVPSTLADVLQLSIDAHAAYDSLTVDQKKAFDNDFNKFFASAGEKEWCEKLGLVSDDSSVFDPVGSIKKEGVVDAS